MGTHQPGSMWNVIDLASCLVNSQLVLDNTHSCFTKMRKKMDLSCVQCIKMYVQVGAWAEAIFLTCKTACRWLRLTCRAIGSNEPLLKWYRGSYAWHIPQFQAPERNVLGTSYYFHGVLFLTLNKQMAERFRDALACHTITRDQGGAVLCTWSSKCWTGAPRPAGNTRECSSVNGIWGLMRLDSFMQWNDVGKGSNLIKLTSIFLVKHFL